MAAHAHSFLLPLIHSTVVVMTAHAHTQLTMSHSNFEMMIAMMNMTADITTLINTRAIVS